jgi:hypothetical protein
LSASPSATEGCAKRIFKGRWKWDTWEDFFAAWFVDTVGVAIFTAIALAAIIFSQKFFLGHNKEVQDLSFYIVMTVLVGALFIGFIAMHRSSSDDDDFDEGMDMGRGVARNVAG